MAETMTYSQLLEDVQVYAERNDKPFIAQIPRFVMLAENRIATEVKGLGFVRFVSSQFVNGNPVIKKPARWRETASFSAVDSAGKRHFVKQRSYTYCRTYSASGLQTEIPKYYADYDYEHLFVAPTPFVGLPVEPATFELSYFERPQPLAEDNQVNWTTQYAPQLLLYATLLEAQPFLKRPERTSEFQALFDRAAAAVKNEADRRLAGDQALIRTGLQ